MSSGNDGMRAAARRVVALEAELEATRATIKRLRKAAARSTGGSEGAARLAQAVLRAGALQTEIGRLSQDVSEVAVDRARGCRKPRQKRPQKAGIEGDPRKTGGKRDSRSPVMLRAQPGRARSRSVSAAHAAVRRRFAARGSASSAGTMAGAAVSDATSSGGGLSGGGATIAAAPWASRFGR